MKVRIVNGIGAWCSQETYQEVIKRHGLFCWYCGQQLAEFKNFIRKGNFRLPPSGYVGLLFDHVTPKCQGGGNNIENLVPACNKCNAGKGGRTLEQYRLLKAKQKGLAFHIFWAEQKQTQEGQKGADYGISG